MFLKVLLAGDCYLLFFLCNFVVVVVGGRVIKRVIGVFYAENHNAYNMIGR